MYSPKIDETLIPKLYRLARAKGVRMTKLVNEIIRAAIEGIEIAEVQVTENKNAPDMKYVIVNEKAGVVQ